MTETESPDVRVFLRGVGTKIRFVIRNMGTAPAREVRFEIDTAPGRNSPLVASEYDARIPIPSLGPDEECELSAVVTTGTGIEFTARLAWLDTDGTERRLETLLAV